MGSGPQRVIIVTGTPGVGKTTVSVELAGRLSAELVSMGELVKKEKLVTEDDAARETIIADIKKLRTRIRSILRKPKRDLVIEGHYAYDVVPKTATPYVFVLRRDPDDLTDSLKARGYSEKKVSENVAAEVLDVCLIGAIKRFGEERVDEIDTTHMDPHMVVNEIVAVLEGRMSVGSGKVDWLGRLEEEGRLEGFLSQVVRVEGVEHGHPRDDS